MTIGILLADDQELMRMGFRMVIDSQPDLEVVVFTYETGLITPAGG